MSKIIVAPSILSADFVNLQRDIEKIRKGQEPIGYMLTLWIGIFVPNIPSVFLL